MLGSPVRLGPHGMGIVATALAVEAGQTLRKRRSVRPEPSAETAMPAAISTSTSTVKLIVRGAAISAKRSDHGSTIVTLAIQSSATAAAAPKKPTTSPSITKGQRMNQL